MFNDYSVFKSETIKPSTKLHIKKHPFNNRRTLIYGFCVLGSLILVTVATCAILTFLNRPTIEDDFFVSDDTKTTISISPTGSSSSSSRQTRVVYEYDGENVVGMKTYFEYSDADAAATAYASLKDQPEFKSSTLQGRYIIVTADESQYKGLTASDIRQQAEAIRAYQAQQNSSSSEDN